MSVLDFNGSSSGTLGSWAVKLSKIRKVTKARGSFPNDEAVMKLLYLALRNIAKNGPCPSTTGRPPSTASQFFTKTGCRPTDRRKEGFGNRGKIKDIFPPFPQPLLLNKNKNKEPKSKLKSDHYTKFLTLPTVPKPLLLDKMKTKNKNQN